MAKHRSPLVCQHLENIAADGLEQYQKIIRQYVRKRHGIYAMYRKDKLYYVGLARNLNSRLKQHLRDRHRGAWDRFSVYLTIGEGPIKELESLLLRIVKPTGNRQSGKFANSENLRKRLSKDIREQHRQQLAALVGWLDDEDDEVEDVYDGRTPILSAYKTGRMKLRAMYRGSTVKAQVRRDGTIRYKGKIFTSPSLAARAVVGRAKNGWSFWLYERAPGDWVKLNELRR